MSEIELLRQRYPDATTEELIEEWADLHQVIYAQEWGIPEDEAHWRLVDLWRLSLREPLDPRVEIDPMDLPGDLVWGPTSAIPELPEVDEAELDEDLMETSRTPSPYQLAFEFLKPR